MSTSTEAKSRVYDVRRQDDSSFYESCDLIECAICGGKTNHNVCRHMNFERDEVGFKCRNCRRIFFVPYRDVRGFDNP